MGKESIFEIIKRWIGGIAFDVFIWSLPMTKEQYWREIWKQEWNRLLNKEE